MRKPGERRLNMELFFKPLYGAALLMLLLFLTACSDSDTPMRTYEVTVMNLTNNQPFSPIAMVLHSAGFSGIPLGTSASAGLELLAESGDNSLFLTEADNNAQVDSTASGNGVIPPGMRETITLRGIGTQLSLAGMLVNTNDAIAAISGVDLGTLMLNETVTFSANAYDAGTEGNSEASADVPGPAGGGEGFNITRDDRDFIITHPGIISIDGGLAGSVLNGSHRFDNPPARIVVKRTS